MCYAKFLLYYDIDFGRPGVRGSNVIDAGLLRIRTSRMDTNYESVISVACVAIFDFLDGPTMFDNNRSIVNISI